MAIFELIIDNDGGIYAPDFRYTLKRHFFHFCLK